jgi:NhaP-type Na+/H+ or K+/H+ antiporter
MTFEVAIIVIAGAVFAVVAVSGRLYRAWLTEPLVAMVFGILLATFFEGPIDLEGEVSLTFLELTLALVLFADAARIDPAKLRREYAWPTRMLLIGMPLAIAGGAVAGALILGSGLGMALLVGVVLSPTDAALAEPVLETEALPIRIRQTLNIESGLNDGLALPALLVAVGIIQAEIGTNGGGAVAVVVRQVGLGLGGGVVFGYLGALVIGRGTRHGWMSPLHQKIAAVALALLAFASVQLVGGSGFVATFVAGAVLGARVRPRMDYLYEFAHTEGRTLVLIAFVLIGAGPVRDIAEAGVEPQVWALALLSVFAIRPLAIVISLIGQKLMLSTAAFLGWFGPRGLATIVFMLVAFDELGDMPRDLFEVAVLTVALSVVLHGVSATPLSNWLTTRLARHEDESMPEMGEAFEHPTRAVTPPSPD